MIKVARTQTVISPERPMPLMGHAMRKGNSTGVHDDLEAHVLSLVVDGERCCWINADVISFEADFTERLRNELEQEFQIRKELVIVSATHTHSGPLMMDSPFDSQCCDPDYVESVYQKILGACRVVIGQEQPVDHVLYQKGESYGFYGNRNSRDKAGDPWIHILHFQDEHDQDLAALVNLSCHCTVNSPLEMQFSADLFGVIRRALTPVYGVAPIMAQGNAGDISNRQYREGNDFAALDRTAQGIVDQILQFAPGERIELGHVQARPFHFVVDYKNDQDAYRRKLVELEARLEQAAAFDDRKWLISEISGCRRKMQMDQVHVDFGCTVIRIQDLEIVVLPCELASAFGLQIKRASTARCALVWGYANGHTTYVVEASEFNGGHDGISTILPKGKAEEFVGIILQHLFDEG